jgi:hypothetical protein
MGRAEITIESPSNAGIKAAISGRIISRIRAGKREMIRTVLRKSGGPCMTGLNGFR